MMMSITFIFKDENEKRQHENAIHRISREMGISEETVTILYEEILEKYWGDSKIKSFLSILVSREVKETISSKIR